MSRKRYAVRDGLAHARPPYDVLAVLDALEAARAAGLRAWKLLGSRQKRALGELIPGQVHGLVGYPREVRLALTRMGLLEHRTDEMWELSEPGVEVKLAGTRNKATQ